MIGVKIKYLRIQQGYSITQLAKKAQISKSYLSYLEKNPETNPSLHIISKIAAALDTSPNYFIEETKNEGSKEISQEWMDLFEEGITKEDFREFQKYLEFIKYRKSH
ncbi:helix-turn-helix domain-containing protein [Domibacillus sp. A3M-37]|uniref:helix-turn-helix domain-containing protein n=1 Tax=Domibacillus sp. A3M-37 TaxID=2962037 RepID=UPI0020B7E489|nr:helix-turn-helix transcriptional regulator [Domibacillus sp. A3M-37]MCP3761341.1 helix-turn-helix domain-containing protein [Domibacillus sp. A3M-37]